MSIEAYLRSGDFLIFLDETLRGHAHELVEHCLRVHDKPVAKAQVYAIPAMLTAKPPEGLKQLAAKRIDKETVAATKDFWRLVEAIVDPEPDQDDEMALRNLVIKELHAHQLLHVGTGRREKKENRERLELALAHSVIPYFEHFVCHYLYRYKRPDREHP